jgi:enoyl-CoA hydratase
MKDASEILVDKQQTGLTILTLNRPEVKNAVNPALRARLAAELKAAEADESVRAVIVAGGAVFSAGADLRALNAPGGTTATGSVEMWAVFNAFPKPIIAAVEGPAIGVGCEFCLASDMIIASKSASFRLPEVKRGFIPGAGGTQRLIRAVGKYRAMRFILTGEPISAEEAYEWGLLSDLTEPGAALPRARELAATIVDMPESCVEAVKTLLVSGPDRSLPEAMAMERQALLGLLDSPERWRRAQDFLEKKTS